MKRMMPNFDDMVLTQRRPGFLSRLVALVQVTMLIFLAFGSVGVSAQSATAYLAGQSSNTGSGSGTSVVLTVPSSAMVGDLLLAQVAAAGLTGCGQITPPAGWSLAVPCNASSGHIVQGVYSKTAAAADLNASRTWTLASSQNFAGNMVAYRNSGGIDVDNDQANGSSGTVTAPSVTTTVAADVVVAFFSSANSTTISPSASLNFEAGTASSAGASATVADFMQVAAGATGAQTATLGANSRSIGALVAIKPSTTGVCNPPPVVVAALGPISNGTYSCYCDNFDRTSLNPSPIFASSWLTSSSNGTFGNPRIVAPGRLRLTDNTGDDASAATAPGIYPAAGNYISVEFTHYAYNGSGADGVAVTLSDSSISAVPGGYGGSQGYAPEGTPGFAGGWLGVALDEYGNYSNPTEGRNGGPGFIAEQVGMRGPGSGTNGYMWISGSGGMPGGLSIDNHTSLAPATGYLYQVVVDARNEATGTINVSVSRDSTTMSGANYSSIIPATNVYSAAQNALTNGWISQIVPNYWQISFTSSTGGSTNIHEIGGLRICAQSIFPPTGEPASGFSAIDSAYGATVPAYPNFQTGDIYMKLAGTPFKLWVAALTSSAISTGYSATSNKYVLVNLVPNLGQAAGQACAPATCSVACTGQAPVEAGASQIASFFSSTPGAVLTPSFTLNSAYKNLMAVMKECTTSACTSFTATAPACSVDAFSVRPTSVTLSSSANNAGTTGLPTVKAGGNFTVTATTTAGYTGTYAVNPAAINVVAPATVLGVLTNSGFSAANGASPNSTATATFTYSDVGAVFLGTTSASPPPYIVPPFVYDETWTAVDSVTTKNDCNTDLNVMTDLGFSNTMDSKGKYGCYFGNASGITVGRFIPDHFDTLIIPGVCPVTFSCPVSIGYTSTGYTYSGQPFGVQVTARNSGGGTTFNYDTSTMGLAKPVSFTILDEATGLVVNPGPATLANGSIFTNTATPSFSAGVSTILATSGSLSYKFRNVPTAPTQIRFRASDTDGVTSLQSSLATSNEGQTLIENGRTRISSAFGSALIPLPVTALLEYWNGTAWVPNLTDQTTSFNSAISPGGNIVAGNYQNNLTSVSVTGSVLSLMFVNGITSFTLAAPGSAHNGSVDLYINSPSYLGEVTGRATFGVYKGGPVIYIRENF